MEFFNYDMLETKNRELAVCRQQAEDAISLVSSTISSLETINETTQRKIEEIETCQAQLQSTKDGLTEAHKKNDRVIQNFKALLGE